jgi:GDPmannose 4,6-dehydratase
MWRILQQDEPDDYVLATGRTTTIRSFVEMAFERAGFKIVWKGEGIDEKGFDEATDRVLIEVDPAYFRPTEVELLLGDSTKAKQKLGWEPQLSLEELVDDMMEHDLADAKRENLLKSNGYSVANPQE